MSDAIFRKVECPYCGAPVFFSSETAPIICEYCDKQLHFDDGIQRTYTKHEEVHVDAYKLAELEYEKQKFEYEKKRQSREDVAHFLNSLFKGNTPPSSPQPNTWAEYRTPYKEPAASTKSSKKAAEKKRRRFWGYFFWVIAVFVIFTLSEEIPPLVLVGPILLSIIFPRFSRHNFLWKLLIWVILESIFFSAFF